MNSFEFNKIAMAVLMTALAIIGLNSLSEIIFHEEAHAANAYPIETDVVVTASAGPVEEEVGPSLGELMTMASIDKGMRVFKKCKACHTTEKGGKKSTGPNLWDIVGRAKASTAGFKYSGNMAAAGGEWSFEHLDEFLTKPKAFVPKTKMTFAGLKKATDRASLMLFLRTLSDSPADLPAVPVAAVVEEVVEEAVEVPAPEAVEAPETH